MTDQKDDNLSKTTTNFLISLNSKQNYGEKNIKIECDQRIPENL